MKGTPLPFVPTDSELRNLDRAIQWSREKETDNWCHEFDETTGEGCQWWRDGNPPTLATCRACPVFWYFCPGCKQIQSYIHSMPKIWPVVADFIGRINVSERFNVPLWPSDWRSIPLREWVYLRQAAKSKNESDARALEEQKRRMRNMNQ